MPFFLLFVCLGLSIEPVESGRLGTFNVQAAVNGFCPVSDSFEGRECNLKGRQPLFWLSTGLDNSCWGSNVTRCQPGAPRHFYIVIILYFSHFPTYMYLYEAYLNGFFTVLIVLNYVEPKITPKLYVTIIKVYLLFLYIFLYVFYEVIYILFLIF